METELKFALGKVIGEIYRSQKANGDVNVSDSHIYGLLNGFEDSVNKEFSTEFTISSAKVETVSQYFYPFYTGERDVAELNSFNARMDLERQGISESEYHQILKFLKAEGRYEIEIEKLGNYSLDQFDL